ncbi:MAG: hypothetical protein FWF54_10500 [Candidatus Azobacteroides sp.]|jgi:hypothetical protein|nr:hypothetical protein [Candidatus Azobacteroides sp.]
MDNEELQNYRFNEPQQEVPNATVVLILGIASIVTCCCYGIPGLICGIITLILSGKGMNAYKGNPLMYTQSSYNNLKAGRICGIIGLSLSAIYFIIVLICLIVYGVAALSNPEQFFNSRF